jgi:hypothetical protein
MLVVAIAVIVISVVTVSRIRTIFGTDSMVGVASAPMDDTKSLNPKVVTYEITGLPGAVADINYLDLDARAQRVGDALLPWSLKLETYAPSVSPNIVAQGDGATITCRIIVDDQLRDLRTVEGINAQTFCLVKSA